LEDCDVTGEISLIGLKKTYTLMWKGFSSSLWDYIFWQLIISDSIISKLVNLTHE
jgi:hypothetical protein